MELLSWLLNGAFITLPEAEGSEERSIQYFATSKVGQTLEFQVVGVTDVCLLGQRCRGVYQGVQSCLTAAG